MMGEAPARINLELCSGMGRDLYREVGSHPMDEPIPYVRADIVDELHAVLGRFIDRATLYAGGPDMPMAGNHDIYLVKAARAASAKLEGGA